MGARALVSCLPGRQVLVGLVYVVIGYVLRARPPPGRRRHGPAPNEKAAFHRTPMRLARPCGSVPAELVQHHWRVVVLGMPRWQQLGRLSGHVHLQCRLQHHRLWLVARVQGVPGQHLQPHWLGQLHRVPVRQQQRRRRVHVSVQPGLCPLGLGAVAQLHRVQRRLVQPGRRALHRYAVGASLAGASRARRWLTAALGAFVGVAGWGVARVAALLFYFRAMRFRKPAMAARTAMRRPRSASAARSTPSAPRAQRRAHASPDTRPTATAPT